MGTSCLAWSCRRRGGTFERWRVSCGVDIVGVPRRRPRRRLRAARIDAGLVARVLLLLAELYVSVGLLVRPKHVPPRRNLGSPTMARAAATATATRPLDRFCACAGLT